MLVLLQTCCVTVSKTLPTLSLFPHLQLIIIDPKLIVPLEKTPGSEGLLSFSQEGQEAGGGRLIKQSPVS